MSLLLEMIFWVFFFGVLLLVVRTAIGMAVRGNSPAAPHPPRRDDAFWQAGNVSDDAGTYSLMSATSDSSATSSFAESTYSGDSAGDYGSDSGGGDSGGSGGGDTAGGSDSGSGSDSGGGGGGGW